MADDHDGQGESAFIEKSPLIRTAETDSHTTIGISNRGCMNVRNCADRKNHSGKNVHPPLSQASGTGPGVSLISKSPRIATNCRESPRIAANRSRLYSGANNPLRPSAAVCISITSFK